MAVAAVFAAFLIGVIVEPLATHRARLADMTNSVKYLPSRLRRPLVDASGLGQLLLLTASLAVVLDVAGAEKAAGALAVVLAAPYLAHVGAAVSRRDVASCGCSSLAGTPSAWSFLPATALLAGSAGLMWGANVSLEPSSVAAQYGVMFSAAALGFTTHSLSAVVSLRRQAWTPS